MNMLLISGPQNHNIPEVSNLIHSNASCSFWDLNFPLDVYKFPPTLSIFVGIPSYAHCSIPLPRVASARPSARRGVRFQSWPSTTSATTRTTSTRDAVRGRPWTNTTGPSWRKVRVWKMATGWTLGRETKKKWGDKQKIPMCWYGLMELKGKQWELKGKQWVWATQLFETPNFRWMEAVLWWYTGLSSTGNSSKDGQWTRQSWKNDFLSAVSSECNRCYH